MSSKRDGHKTYFRRRLGDYQPYQVTSGNAFRDSMESKYEDNAEIVVEMGVPLQFEEIPLKQISPKLYSICERSVPSNQMGQEIGDCRFKQKLSDKSTALDHSEGKNGKFENGAPHEPKTNLATVEPVATSTCDVKSFRFSNVRNDWENGNSEYRYSSAKKFPNLRPNHSKQPSTHHQRGRPSLHYAPKPAERLSLFPSQREQEQQAEIFTPIFTEITQNLTDKLLKFPQNTTVPFFIKSRSIKDSFNGNDSSWKWGHSRYVRLPFKALHQSTTPHMKRGKYWENIEKQLQRLKLACLSYDIKADFARVMNSVISKYTSEIFQKSNFGILCQRELQESLMTHIPTIVDFALQLPNLLSEPIPILNSGQSKTIYLSRRLCCSLLANAFFCTFPEPTGHYLLPDFNFFRLFSDNYSGRSEVKIEKIKCILNYFSSIFKMDKKFLSEIVSFERRFVPGRVDWEKSDKNLCQVNVEMNGKIEDADGMLQVDFANKLVGGGVLGEGSVMEEIRFCISPELIVSRLFTEALGDDEVLVVTGSQIYSMYSGYSRSFKYAGPSQGDPNERQVDNLGRTFTQVVAMDALKLTDYDANNQFQKNYIDRELHKCYVAFIHSKSMSTPVATGNWGCGAFNGNPELKFLIQWMAASHQERPGILFHTVGDKYQTKSILDITELLKEKNLKVGQVYKAVIKFHRELCNQPNSSLFKFIKDSLETSEESGRKGFLGCIGFGSCVV